MHRIYYLSEYAGARDFPFHIDDALVEGRFPEHAHDFIELVVITNGAARHVVNGISYEIGEGDIYVMNRGAVHAFEDARSLQLVNVVYTQDLLDSVSTGIRATPGYQALFVISPSSAGEYRCTMRVDYATLVGVTYQLDRLKDEYRNKGTGHRHMIRALLTQLVVTLARAYSESQSAVRGPDIARRMAQAVSHMESRFDQTHRIDDLARMAGMSRRHFMRMFRLLYGDTPQRHLTAARMSHARNLLRRPELSIAEVAHQCGYEDSNYFTRQFTRQTGQPPRMFRNASNIK